MRFLMTALCGLWMIAATAQRCTLSGRLRNASDRTPASGALVLVPGRALAAADDEGFFTCPPLPYGKAVLVAGADTFRLLLDRPKLELGDLQIRVPNAVLPEPAAEPVAAAEDPVRSQEISAPLHAAQDGTASLIQYSGSGYRRRALRYGQQSGYLNGLLLNGTAQSGGDRFGMLAYLVRSRAETGPGQYSEAGPASLAGASETVALAASLPKQTRLNLGYSNRGSGTRLRYIASSGSLPSGWSGAIGLTASGAQEGLSQGTPGRAYGGVAMGSRQSGRITWNALLSADYRLRGKSHPLTQEEIDLRGYSYNANWGLQQGTVRNARLSAEWDRFAALTMQYLRQDRTRLTLTLAGRLRQGREGGLDWYGGDDPRPDYYRKMPSWAVRGGQDPGNALFLEQPQLDWDALCQVNYAHAAVNPATGQRQHQSVYVTYDDVTRSKTLLWGALWQHRNARGNWKLYGSLSGSTGSDEYYRELTDLLGGDFFPDRNVFAAPEPGNLLRDRNDADQPDRAVYDGDRYHHHYRMQRSEAQGWVQAVFHQGRWELFGSAARNLAMWRREGLVRNGAFDRESVGWSSPLLLAGSSGQAGASYALSGRTYLGLSVSSLQQLPSVRDLYRAPAWHARVAEGARGSRYRTLEVYGAHRSPRWTVRMAGYVQEQLDGTEIRRFYNDDPQLQTFVQYVLSQLQTRNIGAELAAQYRPLPSLELGLSLSWCQHFFTADPAIAIYGDSDTSDTPVRRHAYLENYFVGGNPQTALIGSVQYQTRSYWTFQLYANYLDRNYLVPNPERRTEEAAGLLDRDGAVLRRILSQERLPAVHTVSISARKSLLLSRWMKRLPKTFLYANAGVQNLLGGGFKTGGYEQLRYRFSDADPGVFPAKYFVSPGRSYYLSLTLKI